jgi:hypothetical protein
MVASLLSWLVEGECEVTIHHRQPELHPSVNYRLCITEPML